MKLIIALCAPLLFNSVWAAPHQTADSSQALDQQLAATLQSMSIGNMAEARILARQTAHKFPNSDLAQLLSAELAAISAHQKTRAADTGAMSKQLEALLQEARARLKSRANPSNASIDHQLPDEVIQLGTDVSTLLVGDLSSYTLYHIGVNERLPTLVQQHYIGGGKAGFGKRVEGDKKTPQGLYNINGQRSDASLPDLYGAGALTLDYPNALDRQLGRTGSGIWLHGVPRKQRNRAPQSSEGCVTMSNDHFISLRQRLLNGQDAAKWSDRAPPGRPLVLLTHAVRWVDEQDQAAQQAQFQELFARYQQAWEQRNLIELLFLYEALDPVLDNLEQFDGADNSVLQQLSTVDKRDISIFRNPSNGSSDTDVELAEAERSYIVMRFQTGDSNENQLTIYWGLGDDQQWRVVTEQWNVVNS